MALFRPCAGRWSSTRRRLACLAGALGSLGLAVAYFRVAAWIVLEERWGPVVGTVSETHGMGIHAGDLVGVVVAMAALACALGFAVLLGGVIAPQPRPASAGAYRPQRRL